MRFWFPEFDRSNRFTAAKNTDNYYKERILQEIVKDERVALKRLRKLTKLKARVRKSELLKRDICDLIRDAKMLTDDVIQDIYAEIEKEQHKLANEQETLREWGKTRLSRSDKLLMEVGIAQELANHEMARERFEKAVAYQKEFALNAAEKERQAAQFARETVASEQFIAKFLEREYNEMAYENTQLMRQQRDYYEGVRKQMAEPERKKYDAQLVQAKVKLRRQHERRREWLEDLKAWGLQDQEAYMAELTRQVSKSERKKAHQFDKLGRIRAESKKRAERLAVSIMKTHRLAKKVARQLAEDSARLEVLAKQNAEQRARENPKPPANDDSDDDSNDDSNDGADDGADDGAEKNAEDPLVAQAYAEVDAEEQGFVFPSHLRRAMSARIVWDNVRGMQEAADAQSYLDAREDYLRQALEEDPEYKMTPEEEARRTADHEAIQSYIQEEAEYNRLLQLWQDPEYRRAAEERARQASIQDPTQPQPISEEVYRELLAEELAEPFVSIDDYLDYGSSEGEDDGEDSNEENNRPVDPVTGYYYSDDPVEYVSPEDEEDWDLD